MIGGPAKEILDDALSLDTLASQEKNSIHEDDTTSLQENEYHQSSIHQIPGQYSINEIGQKYYTHHMHQHLTPSLPHYRQPQSLYDAPLSASNDVKTEPIEPISPIPSAPHLLTDIDSSLIDLYFEHVHPYTPMIRKSAFKLQIKAVENSSPRPSFQLLVYAMCAIAARWSPSSSSSPQPNEPSGFSYYQRASAFFDEASASPCITTIQALILLTKYQEQYKHAGYFYRPGYYLTIAIDMCFSLKLPSLVASDGDMSGVESNNYETRKRTFWMTFLYDLWISIENGRETSFNTSQCSTDYPSPNGGDLDDDGELVTRHNLVIRLARTLSDIYGFSQRLGSRQQIQGTVRTSNQQIEEEGRLLVLQTALETYLRDISIMSSFDLTPSTTEIGKYPVELGTSIPNVFTGFLHMVYHYSIILLHRHHVLYPITKQSNNDGIHPPPFPHQQLCATSASIINNIAESIMESSAALDVFHYPTCGVQFTILCVTMAIAVHKFEMETAQDDHRKSMASTLYWQALSIINRLATETSAIEITYLAKDAELAELCGKLAMDSNNSNNNNSVLQSLSTESNAAYNSEASPSTSTSPIIITSNLANTTGSSADRISRPTILAKPRRGTISGPHIRRFPAPMIQPDTASSPIATRTSSPTPSSPSSSSSATSNTHLSSVQQNSPRCSSSTINPAILFNSSASITDPARLASLMTHGSIPTTSYNHHQQPIQVPATMNGTPQQHQQQPSQRHMSRTLHHQYSQSQENLRSLNHQHMNNKTGYTRAADPGEPPQGRLKKHRSMKFLPMHTHQLQHTVQNLPPSSLQTHQLQPQYQHSMYQQPYQHQHSSYQPFMQMSHQNHQRQTSTNFIPQQQQQIYYPVTTTTTTKTSEAPINRRHTISFTDMDISSFMPPPTTIPLNYSSSPPGSSSMMQMNTTSNNNNTSDQHQHQQPPPAIPTTATTTQPIHSTSVYAPMMMECDSQVTMMMDPSANMVHANAWENVSFNMDRKVEDQALQ
ncbi:fungal-specific transcription factor domain-domain-containing protein [Absidia repens]|uniref:Fungal-specific transcription factor domain-domain-containing protein n=1 Tax=Absidia repens TaxID=90262 RepID=A0A1X2IQI4_9FUNG|nr:fungal-specific transcription factor domain-domain-containing protein [Absidia repens]